MNARMLSSSIAILALASALVSLEAASISSIEPAYSSVVNGSTFKVRVTVTGAAYTGSHYVSVSAAGTTGFEVKTGSQFISHLAAGKSQTLEFTVLAPTGSRTGFINVASKWSTIYSGAGTYLTDQRAKPISSTPGWNVSVQLNNPGGLLAGNQPTVWSISDSWRYTSTKSSTSVPYYVTFTVPSVSATYSIGGTWWLLNPLNVKSPLPRGSTKIVTITRSGQVITF